MLMGVVTAQLVLFALLINTLCTISQYSGSTNSALPASCKVALVISDYTTPMQDLLLKTSMTGMIAVAAMQSNFNPRD